MQEQLLHTWFILYCMSVQYKSVRQKLYKSMISSSELASEWLHVSGHLHVCGADSLGLTDVAVGVWSPVWSWHLYNEKGASVCISLSSETSPTPELYSVSPSVISTKCLVRGLYWVAWQLILYLSMHLHILNHAAEIVFFFFFRDSWQFWDHSGLSQQIDSTTQCP